jgi:hypothetical protein
VSNQPPGGFNWSLGPTEPDDEQEPRVPSQQQQPSQQWPASQAPAQPGPPLVPPGQYPHGQYPPQGQYPPAPYPPGQYPPTQYPSAPSQPTSGQPAPSQPAPSQPYQGQPAQPQYPASPPPPFQPPQFGQSPTQPGYPPAQPQAPFQAPVAPTEAYVFPNTESDRPYFDDVPTQAMSFSPAPAAAPEQPASFGAGLPGLRADGPTPTVATSGIDSLFGEAAFQEYDAGVLPAEGFSGLVGGRVRSEARPPMSRVQKVLLGVAGGLGAALTLLALFGLGTKIELPKPAPVAEDAGPATPVVASAPPAGPVAPGEHAWSDLLGTECVDPYTSAWQESYTVVDCSSPHAAQMVYHGIFDDEAFAPYPGADVLQSRVNLLCTPSSVIDYAAAKKYADIQFSASYPANDAQWIAGNRSYYCFINRASGDVLEATVAEPPVVAAAPISSVPSNDP